MPTSTVEDYLKAISRLSGETGDLAPLGKVAEALGVTAGTATTMMKQLDRQGFADYSPRKGVALTEKGHLAAMRVLRRHRLLELFLVDVMKFDWAEVHEEAEVLEHAISERLVNRIDEMLGLPARDPHGGPIPDAHGVMRHDDSQRLDGCPAGKYRLAKVTRTDPDFLSWLSAGGLVPGTVFQLAARDELADLFRIRVTGRDENLQFGHKVAEELWVLPTGEDPAG